MRCEILTEIDIRVRPERLWAILADFNAYPAWNPVIRLIAGTPDQGARLRMVIQPAERASFIIRPVVMVATPTVELRWLAHFVVPGFFDQEHFFKIRRSGSGAVCFSNGTGIGGIMSAFKSGSFERRRRAELVAMNEALKIRAESNLPLEPGHKLPVAPAIQWPQLANILRG